MQRMEIQSTDLPGVYLILPDVHKDERGFFSELFSAEKFSQAGLPADFVQDNHSGSTRGVLRGLHYQLHDPQGKLVSVIRGEVFDVAVDLRRSSETFGRWCGARLSGENKHQLWIPPGFGHGFLVLSDWADVLYKVTEPFAPEWDRSLRWDDPTIGIGWPLDANASPLLSTKDAQAPFLTEAEVFP